MALELHAIAQKQGLWIAGESMPFWTPDRPARMCGAGRTLEAERTWSSPVSMW